MTEQSGYIGIYTGLLDGWPDDGISIHNRDKRWFASPLCLDRLSDSASLPYRRRRGLYPLR